MLNRLLISTALVAAMGTAASAATVSYSGSLADQSTNYSGVSVGVQQFDSSLGTLNSVSISLTGSVSGIFEYESRDNSASTVNMNLSAQVSLATSSLGQLIVALPTLMQSFATTAFDGDRDFAGTSGGTITGLTSTANESTSLLGGDMSEFVGTGLVNLLVSGTGNSSASGPGNLSQDFTTFAGAQITVTYDYDVAPPPSTVPLPAGMPLLLLGMGAMGLAAKRRKA